MYTAGKYADHVTRYNHKNQSRWMVQTALPRRGRALDVLSVVAIVVSVPALIVSAVIILQGVGM